MTLLLIERWSGTVSPHLFLNTTDIAESRSCRNWFFWGEILGQGHKIEAIYLSAELLSAVLYCGKYVVLHSAQWGWLQAGDGPFGQVCGHGVFVSSLKSIPQAQEAQMAHCSILWISPHHLCGLKLNLSRIFPRAAHRASISLTKNNGFQAPPF